MTLSELIAPETWAVFANVHGDKVFRDGAKVGLSFVAGGGPECAEVVGLSKGGRRITKFTQTKRLSNFRIGFVPPALQGHLLEADTKDDAWLAGKVQLLTSVARGAK